MNCQEYWNTMPEFDEVGGSGHLMDCSACASRMARRRELQTGLRSMADGFRRVGAPARVEARLLVAFRRQSGNEIRMPGRRRVRAATWVAAFAAMLALAAFLVRPVTHEPMRPAVQRIVDVAALEPQADSDGFIALPNSAGVVPDGDDVNLVRMEVPRSAMIALGLDISADRAEELVEADVMLGSNGIARAVRFLDE